MNFLNKTSAKFIIGFLAIIFFGIIGLVITKSIGDRQTEKAGLIKTQAAQ